jgi:plastocyanin
MASASKVAERATPWKLRTAATTISLLAVLATSMAAWAGDAAVKISGFAFNPQTLTVPLGTTVTWTNEDGAPHIVSDKGGAFRSERLGKGDTFSQEFSQAGTFDYVCAIHASMTGTIVVTP